MLRVIPLKKHILSTRLLSTGACLRQFSAVAASKKQDAWVLGAFQGDSTDSTEDAANDVRLTPTAQHFNADTAGRLMQACSNAGVTGKANEVKLLYGLGDAFPSCIAVVGLGRQESEPEAATAVRALRGQGAQNVAIEPLTSAHGAAEGATLGLFSFDALKAAPKRKKSVDLALLDPVNHATAQFGLSWNSGLVYGQAQNMARMLMEMPANLMTPSIFSSKAQELLGTENNQVQVTIHDHAWAKEHNMNAFLAVSQGSQEPLKFAEIHYRGSPQRDCIDLALVGKGVTFDSGGISIKPSANMALMKGDMGGAAVVLSAMHAVAQLKMKANVSAFIPLCENMPSGSAVKPGDVVTAMNGKTIEIDNTDAEGRLILADAIYYANKVYQPKRIVDVATLTGAMDVALGPVKTGVFANSHQFYAELHACSRVMGDEFWRMPLHPDFLSMMKSHVADMRNAGGRSAGACTAAQFLKEFLHHVDREHPVGSTMADSNDCAPQDGVAWAHLDIAGVMDSNSTANHLVKGMSGRPTRVLIEYARRLGAAATGQPE